MIELLISAISSVFVNIFFLMSIPLIWWFIFHRKKVSFLKFIGLTRPRLKRSFVILIGFMAVYVIFYFTDIFRLIVPLFGEDFDALRTALRENGSMQDNAYYRMGFAALLPGFILTFIANGICEEALFRGFILRRLKEVLRPWPATIIQGLLFGLLHNILFLLGGVSVGLAYHVAMFLNASIAGVLLGVLNEEVFDGESIVPSIIVHGLGNYLGIVIVAF